MNKIVELYLKDKNSKTDTKFIFDEIVEKNDFIVILGAPGSGKSTILEEYENKHSCIKTSFEDFVDYFDDNIEIKKDTKVILIDELDEYKGDQPTNKTPIRKFNTNFKKLPQNIKVVIACREMDWGEKRYEIFLKEYIKEFVIFEILPLNEKQIDELFKINDIDKNDFNEKFQIPEVLTSPLLFDFAKKIYKKDKEDKEVIKSKKDLYENFILKTKGYKKENRDEKKRFFEILGYLAMFKIFSNIDRFDDETLENLECEKYKIGDFEKFLKTPIFKNNDFIHKTLAEFLAAKYLAEYKLSDEILSKYRIKNLFLKNNRIPTSLRNTFAWLCSFTQDWYFIKLDPFYQLIYNDNILDDDLKIKIIEQIQRYDVEEILCFFSEIYKRNIKFDISKEFYSENLDKIIRKNYEDSQNNNHFIYFLNKIVNSTDNLSDEMKEFLEARLFDNKVESYYKADLIKIFEKDINLLKSLLDKIEKNEIEDSENMLREKILDILYPNYITPKEIVEHIKKYNYLKNNTTNITFALKRNRYGKILYLYKTDYKDQFDLVNEILDNFKDERAIISGSIEEFIEPFVQFYFVKTLLEYKKSLKKAEDIYKIIYHFSDKYEYHPDDFGSGFLFYKLQNNELKKEFNNSKEKLQELSNELFKIYVDLNINNFIDIRDFLNRFERYYVLYPNNMKNILYQKITDNKDINLNIIINIIDYIFPKDYYKIPILDDEIKSKIKELNIEKEIDEYLKEFYKTEENKEKKKQHREQKKYGKKELEKKRSIAKEYFQNKSDKDILGDLCFISKCVYDKYYRRDFLLSKETFYRLKNILKNANFKDLNFYNLLNLNSFFEFTYNDIERYYKIIFTILHLKGNGSYKEIIDSESEEFLKYLYINSFKNDRRNDFPIKTNFFKSLEKQKIEFCKNTIKEYMILYIKKHFTPDLGEIFAKYIIKISSLEILKRLFTGTYFIDSFLSYFWLKLDINELKKISNIYDKADAFLVFRKDEFENFTSNMAETILHTFDYIKSNNLDSKTKVKILYFCLSVITKKDLYNNDGLVASYFSLINFPYNFLSQLNLNELNELNELYKKQSNSIWKNDILCYIKLQEQAKSDSEFKLLDIKKLKEFILNDAIISDRDFFDEVCFMLENLKQNIEDNRDNEKNMFYNEDKKSKNENNIRDIIVARLNDRMSENFGKIREKFEGNNRCDINIFHKTKYYEVQVECKKDANKEIINGVNTQLIKKYLSSKVKFGIYLVFYFGEINKSLEDLKKEIKNNIYEEYKNNIKVICINFIKK